MATQKEIAQFFRLALRFGLVDTAAIEHWVDSVITAVPIVRFPFTDLAGASNLSPSKVDELLGQVAGSGEVDVPGRILLSLLRRRIRDNRLAPEVAIKSALAGLYKLGSAERKNSSVEWAWNATPVCMS